MQYSITREPVQEPQTPMFNCQAHSRPSKWKKMLDFCCICDLKCSKTSKPVKHARLASLFMDVLCIPSSIIKASKWCTGNLKKMEAAWTIQSASSYRGHSTNSIFVDRWLHCVCADCRPKHNLQHILIDQMNLIPSHRSVQCVQTEYLSHTDRKCSCINGVWCTAKTCETNSFLINN